MKNIAVKNIKIDDALAFFCFFDRMCEQNRLVSREELLNIGEINAGSVMIVKRKNSYLLAAFISDDLQIVEKDEISKVFEKISSHVLFYLYIYFFVSN